MSYCEKDSERFLVVRSESKERKENWMTKVLLMFSSFAEENMKAAELASVQSRECAVTWDAVGEAPECSCLQWAAADHGEEESSFSLLGEEGVSAVAGKWFGVPFFQSILCIVHVFGKSKAVHPSTITQSETSYTFYVNKFSRESAMIRNDAVGS